MSADEDCPLRQTKKWFEDNVSDLSRSLSHAKQTLDVPYFIGTTLLELELLGHEICGGTSVQAIIETIENHSQVAAAA